MKSIPWDGDTVTKPGLYSGMALEDYHSAVICDGPSISSSGLRKIFSESPADFYATWEGNPQSVEVKESKALAFGRAVHHLHLRHAGQPTFSQLFTVQPEDYEDEKTGEVKKWTYNAKACKRWRDERIAEGKTILTQTEVEAIEGMALKLGEHPIIKAGALNGDVERSLFWKDKATGLWLKSRPDAIPNDSGDFVDYKTVIDVQWNTLVKSLHEHGYYQQAALVLEGAREVLKIANPSFTLVWQQKSPPYSVRVTTLKDNAIALGTKANRAALDTFARCLKSGHWPGPGGEREDAEYIELSDRAASLVDEKITAEAT